MDMKILKNETFGFIFFSFSIFIYIYVVTWHFFASATLFYIIISTTTVILKKDLAVLQYLVHFSSHSLFYPSFPSILYGFRVCFDKIISSGDMLADCWPSASGHALTCDLCSLMVTVGDTC